jgi:hypothetical protein
MSIIIDKMDSNHCKCPHLGTQQTMSNPFNVGITGVKEHGVGLTIFRSLDNISKGANLTIHCISRMLEKFRIRNEQFPEILYLQVKQVRQVKLFRSV